MSAPMTDKELLSEPMAAPVPMPATTTAAEDKVTAGQRAINQKWETTQQIIALSVTFSNLTAALYLVVTAKDAATLALAVALLSNSLFLVVGFYFSRTNHTNIGGVGPKSTDTSEHVGR